MNAKQQELKDTELIRLEQAGWEAEYNEFNDSLMCAFLKPDDHAYIDVWIYENGSLTAAYTRPNAYAANPQVRAGVKIAKEVLHNIVDDVLTGYGFIPESVLPKYRI